MRSRLTTFQKDLLEAFFSLEQRFFLTGGAALAGYHLGHRTTQDLDLFTPGDCLDDGDRALREAANRLGATLSSIQTAPGFHRRLVRRGSESVVVDLVRDPVAKPLSARGKVGSVILDPPEEILANKLCTLLSRAEIRDLVDVRSLEMAGQRIEAAFPRAQEKDAGLTPAQLLWVLSQIRIGNEAKIPGDVAPGVLRTYLEDLRARLARLALPREP